MPISILIVIAIFALVASGTLALHYILEIINSFRVKPEPEYHSSFECSAIRHKSGGF